MEDQSPNSSERSGFLRKEETPPADLNGGKEMAVHSSNEDQVSPGIALWQPSTKAMEEASKKEDVTSDGMTVQAIKTNWKRDSCIMNVQNFDHNYIPHLITACEEEFYPLDLSVQPRGATAVQEDRCEEESHVSAERAAGKTGERNSKNRDGSRKRGQALTEETFYKKGFIQNVSSTSSEGTHTEIKSYICQECGVSFCSLPSLTEHQKSHTGYLPEQDGTYAWGKVHVSSERSSKEDQVFKCFECGMLFTSLLSVAEHQKIHLSEGGQHQRIPPRNELYICSECGQSFYSFSLFAEHQKSHTNNKPFTIGKGHLLLPWMPPPDFPKAALWPPANSAPVLGQAYSPFPRVPIWGPYSLAHPTLSGTPFMHPILDPRSYTQTPLLPTQGSSCYAPGPASSVHKLSLPQEKGPTRSASQKEAGATLSGGNFTGGKVIPTEVSENQGEASLMLNPLQMLDIFQTNETGQSLFPCLDCGELMLNPSQLALHRHDCKREGLLRCPHCKKRFSNEASFRQHEQVHMSENA